MTENLKFVFRRVEKIVRKGENASYQHFFLLPTMFSKALLPKLVKCCDSLVSK